MCMRDVRMPQHTIDSVAFDPLQTEYTFQSTICNEINTAGLRPGLVNHFFKAASGGLSLLLKRKVDTSEIYSSFGVRAHCVSW